MIKNRILKNILKAVLCIPFLILWYYFSLALSVAYSEGVLSVYQDAFGKWFNWLLIIFGVLAFLSIIYLRFIVKKEWKIQMISYLLSFAFAFTMLIFANIGESRFDEFTTEKWIQYPSRRDTMYYCDLEKNYDIKEYTSSQITELFGNPDRITEDGTYVYDDRFGNALYIEFKDDGNYMYFTE